jgi:hypothetical protein
VTLSILGHPLWFSFRSSRQPYQGLFSREHILVERLPQPSLCVLVPATVQNVKIPAEIKALALLAEGIVIFQDERCFFDASQPQDVFVLLLSFMRQIEGHRHAKISPCSLSLVRSRQGCESPQNDEKFKLRFIHSYVSISNS